jgi:hypothetical protein
MWYVIALALAIAECQDIVVEANSVVKGCEADIRHASCCARKSAVPHNDYYVEDQRLRLAGSLGCRPRIAGRVSLSMGYDTHQSGFFGLAGDF